MTGLIEIAGRKGSQIVPAYTFEVFKKVKDLSKKLFWIVNGLNNLE